jgi:hypothetical protein
VAILLQQYLLLAQWQQHLGGLFEEPRQRIELIAQILERPAAGMIGL